MLSTRIEINASPEVVRAKFLNFASIPAYHQNGFIKSLTPTTVPATPSEESHGQNLKRGDKLHVVLDGGVFDPVILDNTPSVFRWRGALPLGLFSGDHAFRFEPSSSSSTTGNATSASQVGGGVTTTTTFIHEEEFSGLLSWMMGDNTVANWMGFRTKTKNGFESFNKDLKAWCERK